MLRNILRILGLLLVSSSVLWLLFVVPKKPSNDKNWWPEQKILAYAETNSNLVTIKSIRNFRFHDSEEQFTPGYYDKTFDLNKLKNVYYIVEKFSKFEGQAHTFVSFEFEGNDFVAITVEARKEIGEDWGPVTGMLRRYELMYVIADERDVLMLRTNTRKHPVYAYPIKTSLEKKQAMFMDMVNAATDLKNNPKFYNTILASCTTTIVKHVNNVTPRKVPFSFKFLLPGYSGKLAYDLGMIDTDLSFQEAENKYYITDKAQSYGDVEDFSLKIRENF